MHRHYTHCLTATLTSVFLFPVSAMASEGREAEHLCKSKIEEVYGVDRFRNVWAERVGNHKFKVHGLVKVRDHKYDFNCKVKNGYVKSYAYDGPHDRHGDNDSDDVGKAVAIGAGLAILAAIVASKADDDGRGRGSELSVSKSRLEDECHDMLQYRIRDEHDYSANVTMQEARLEGRDLIGDAKVRYDRDHPHHATYTCHFDSGGRLLDTRYNLY